MNLPKCVLCAVPIFGPHIIENGQDYHDACYTREHYPQYYSEGAILRMIGGHLTWCQNKTWQPLGDRLKEDGLPKIVDPDVN